MGEIKVTRKIGSKNKPCVCCGALEKTDFFAYVNAGITTDTLLLCDNCLRDLYNKAGKLLNNKPSV